MKILCRCIHSFISIMNEYIVKTVKLYYCSAHIGLKRITPIIKSSDICRHMENVQRLRTFEFRPERNALVTQGRKWPCMFNMMIIYEQIVFLKQVLSQTKLSFPPFSQQLNSQEMQSLLETCNTQCVVMCRLEMDQRLRRFQYAFCSDAHLSSRVHPEQCGVCLWCTELPHSWQDAWHLCACLSACWHFSHSQ